MNVDVLLSFIGFVTIIIMSIGIPFITRRGWRLIALVAVNIIEVIIKETGRGGEKFVWVDSLLAQLFPNISPADRKKVIDSIVSNMNAIRNGLNGGDNNENNKRNTK